MDSIVFYMQNNNDKTVQRNIRLPKELANEWDRFNPPGSQEKSKNASGAIFVFMLMSDEIRFFARECAYLNNFKKAKRYFWKKISDAEQQRNQVKILLAAAKVREIESGKKKADISSEFG